VGAVCYVDVGTWEDWRPDAGSFPRAVLGKSNGWPGEKWLDIRQWSTLEPILTARFTMCAAKGFDGIEADNVDGYSNKTGFPLTASDQLLFNTRMAALAHKVGLPVALKNDVDQVAALQPLFDWAINEQCAQYNECGVYSAFTAAGKAVWNVEYRSSSYPAFCARTYPIFGASSMLRDTNLTPTGVRKVCLSASGR
jgi:hypothetical protein